MLSKTFHLIFGYAAKMTEETAVPETRQRYPQSYNSYPNVVLYQVISVSVFLFALALFYIFLSSSCLCLSFLLCAQNAELSYVP